MFCAIKYTDDIWCNVYYHLKVCVNITKFNGFVFINLEIEGSDSDFLRKLSQVQMNPVIIRQTKRKSDVRLRKGAQVNQC